MDADPDDVFGEDEADSEDEFFRERRSDKELVVYLVDASPKMFENAYPVDDKKDETHFHVAISCIVQSLKTRIINRSYDEVAICFFNTREKRNLQDLNGVYVFNVAEREDMDRPTARLIKVFEHIEGSFIKDIGSQYGILSESRENSLYNALWVSQALLRKRSTETLDKWIFLFTNEDDPFGSTRGAVNKDMIRTTLQRAKDAQVLGISIDLFPLSRPNDEFNMHHFYAELLGLEGEDLVQFIPSAGNRLKDMKNQFRKRMFKKRKVRRITFIIANGLSIKLDTYAFIRQTVPGKITWLDSVTNLPLKIERLLICCDTGALLKEPVKRFQFYKNEKIKFSMEELSEIKRVSNGHLRLLGFKPLSCLMDYHNKRPSTFVFPSDEVMIGSTRIFIALHQSMLRLKRFAVAFYGSSMHPQLVALVAQDEIINEFGQVEPPGMHMIHLPYSEDIRQIEEHHSEIKSVVPRASDDQIKKASALLRRLNLKDFSVCQFSNPALQRHYAVLETLALDEDEMPEIKDETLPDEEGMARPGAVKAVEDFKYSVFGENYKEIDLVSNVKKSEASRKRKEMAEKAVEECAKYDWSDLADNGKLNHLTVAELKLYLTAHELSVSGNKKALIDRILIHMGK